MSFIQDFRVRYNECDMQNVVFNANYWVYADDAVAQFFRHGLATELNIGPDNVDMFSIGFDFMLKTASGTWHKGATYGDVIHAECSVSRWGHTSFDVIVDMAVNGQQVFDCVITYVSVTPGVAQSAPIPDVVRRALGGAVR
jgi:acyl-CoA thioester hydrolase